jgi:hypothetical protein
MLYSGSSHSPAVGPKGRAEDKTTGIPRSFGVPGLKRREMPTEDSEDHPLDARNSIHKEPILSRCSNTETDGSLAHYALEFVSVDTSAHDWCIVSTERRAETM